MNRHVESFLEEFRGRMSTAYYDELLYFTPHCPKPLIDFNNVLLLKRGQKYIRHTENVFQKCVAKMFSNLFCDNGVKAKVCKTDGGKGRGVITKLNGESVRFHFLGQEKFVNFPRVTWFQNLVNGDCMDISVVNINNDHEGMCFLEEANKYLIENNITNKKFIFFEDFVIDYLGEAIWSDIKPAFKLLEKELVKYKWFGLTPYYNELTREAFVNSTKTEMEELDYKALLSKYNYRLERYDFEILKKRFLDSSHNILFGDKDFCGSYITSEWLYKNIKENPSLEKTFIATGYLKSIEQLMAYIIRDKSLPGKQIGINSSRGIVKVDVDSQYFYKATLGNLQHYFDDYTNDDLFDAKISGETIDTINKAIADWIKNERNGYFHKHNIQSFEIISEIREKTLILYFLILGSIE